MKATIIYDTFLGFELEMLIRNGEMMIYVIDKGGRQRTKGVQNWEVRRFYNLGLFAETYEVNELNIKLDKHHFDEFDAFETYEDYVKHINRMVMELDEIDNR